MLQHICVCVCVCVCLCVCLCVCVYVCVYIHTYIRLSLCTGSTSVLVSDRPASKPLYCELSVRLPPIPTPVLLFCGSMMYSRRNDGANLMSSQDASQGSLTLEACRLEAPSANALAAAATAAAEAGARTNGGGSGGGGGGGGDWQIHWLTPHRPGNLRISECTLLPALETLGSPAGLCDTSHVALQRVIESVAPLALRHIA